MMGAAGHPRKGHLNAFQNRTPGGLAVAGTDAGLHPSSGSAIAAVACGLDYATSVAEAVTIW